MKSRSSSSSSRKENTPMPPPSAVALNQSRKPAAVFVNTTERAAARAALKAIATPQEVHNDLLNQVPEDSTSLAKVHGALDPEAATGAAAEALVPGSDTLASSSSAKEAGSSPDAVAVHGALDPASGEEPAPAAAAAEVQVDGGDLLASLNSAKKAGSDPDAVAANTILIHDASTASSSAKEVGSSPDAVAVHGAFPPEDSTPEAATEALAANFMLGASSASSSVSAAADEAPSTGFSILPSNAGAIWTGATVVHPQTGFPPDGKACGAVVVMVLELLVQGLNPDLLKPTTPNHARSAITYSLDAKQLVTLEMLEGPLDALGRERVDVIWMYSKDKKRHLEGWVDFHDGSKLTYKDAFRLTPEHWFSDDIINACVLLMNKYLCEHSLDNATVVMNSFFACKAERNSFDLARWLNKAFAGVHPTRLLMPVHVGGNHWLALSLRLAEGRVIFADVWPGTGQDESFNYADVVAIVVQAVQEFISSTNILPPGAVKSTAAAIRCRICLSEAPRHGKQMCDACHSAVVESRADSASAVVRATPHVVVESSSPAISKPKCRVCIGEPLPGKDMCDACQSAVAYYLADSATPPVAVGSSSDVISNPKCSLCTGALQPGKDMCDACHSVVKESRESSPEWVIPLLPLEAHRLEQLQAARACRLDDIVNVEGTLTRTQTVRARVTDIESDHLEKDADYANYLCTLRSETGVNAHADIMVEGLLYVEDMRRDHTHGDAPEVIIISRDILDAPLVVFEVSRDLEGKPTFRRAADYKNESSSQLTAYLLRSNENAGHPFAAHYDVLVPVVEVEHLNDPKGYGPLLQTMMSLVMVHPVVVKFEITGTPDVILSFFLFGRGNDGSCLFRSAALILEAQEAQKLVCPRTAFFAMPRSLPRLNDEETKRCATKQTQKSLLKEIRNTNWSGEKVLESTSIAGQMRLMKAVRWLFGKPIEKTSVCVDVGAGHGNVALYSDYPMLAIECDPLLSVSLKRMYLILREKGYNLDVGVSFLSINAKNMVSFDGFEVAFLYECHGGTKNGFNDEHKRIVKTLLGSKGLKAFCSTKLQTHCLEGYVEDDAEFEDLLRGWVVFKLDGVSRTKCKPMTYVYVRMEELYPTCNPVFHEVPAFNDRLVKSALHNGPSTELWTVRLNKNGREVSTSQNELRITIGDLVITDNLTSCVISTGDTVSSRDQSGVVIGLACTMPLQNKLPFQLVVVVSCDPLAFQLLDQLDLLQVNSVNRVPITDEQMSQCKMYYKAHVLKICSQQRSSRHAKKANIQSVTPTQQRGSESDSGVDRPQSKREERSKKGKDQAVAPAQETTQEQEMAEKKAKDHAKAQEKIDNQAKAQEKIDRLLEKGRLRLDKSLQQFKKVQVANKAVKQKLRREKTKRTELEAEQEEAEQEEDEQEEDELDNGNEISDSAGYLSSSKETPPITRSKSAGAVRAPSPAETPPIKRPKPMLPTPSPVTRSKHGGALLDPEALELPGKADASNQKLTDLLASSQKMTDLLAATNKKMTETLMSELAKNTRAKEPVQEPVNEMRIQSLLLEVTAKLDSTALSIQRQIENKSRDVKAKEKKRERKAIEAKTFMVQKQFLDMQTAFQEKINEEFAAQRNRSKLENGLKKMKLLMETTKTANAEQGKRAFELEVKRLELAQEQARADARADRADARRHSKRQRSRSARFHFALFCFA